MIEACTNCAVYKWPTENVPTSRCSNCKLLSYCSTECQREHWVKVHKKQCKTLAGQVEVPVSTHLPDHCPSCKEVQSLDVETLNSPDSPVWGCHVVPGYVPKVDAKFPSAIESLDMTRKFTTRTEHTLFVMRQIVGKLIRTNSTRRPSLRASLVWLASLLDNEMKNYIFIRHIHPSKKVETWNIVDHEFLDAVQSSIPRLSINLRHLGDPFLLWETFKLLVCFLLATDMHTNYKDYLRLNVRADLPTEVQELIDDLDTSTQFEETWDSVLDALHVRPVHHHSLLDILCGGKREQQCDQCQKPVIIERMFVPTFDKEPKSVKPFVTFGRRIYSCSALVCQLAILKKENDCENNSFQVTLVMGMKLWAMGLNNRCDYCFIVGSSGHRCSECKTKVYCSQECQQADWGIHEKICNKGEVSRKVKGGKKERVDAAKEEVIETITEYEKKTPIDPRLKQICLDFIKKK